MHFSNHATLPPYHLAARDHAALCTACQEGHAAVVERLLALPLERGVDPAACGNKERSRDPFYPNSASMSSAMAVRAMPVFHGHPWWSWLPLVLVVAVAYITSTATGASSAFKDIELPPMAPPRAAFGVMWALLYVLLGIVATRLLQRAVFTSSVTTPAFIVLSVLFVATFAMNLAWTPTFHQDRKAALLLLLALVAACSSMVPLMASLDTSSACLFMPYLVWLLFAMLLNKELLQ